MPVWRPLCPRLRQSIRDILLTPLGTRVMRRDYGSDLPELLDQNLTPLTLGLIKAATVDALRKWEPRLHITRVQAEPTPEDHKQGRVIMGLEAVYLPDGQNIELAGVVL
ncbi:GPW/gp25 family protein [Thalassobius sp. I31.1]|uniref:GPW/gp25 family protein n=1 Tax=Thalassobius sp. I31.1 TaxID=2109912 RepID=UPI000D1B5513